MEIKERANGGFECIAYYKGQRVHLSALKKSDLKDKVRLWQNSIDDNSIKLKKCPTLGEAFNEYMKRDLSPSTRKAYLSIWNYHLSFKKEALISAISCDDFKVVNVSAKTKKSVYSLLYSVCKEFGVVLEVPKVKKDYVEMKMPTKAEIELLLEKSKGDLHTAIMIGAYLGMRRGEICALEQSDFDYEHRVIHVSKSKVITPEGGYVVKEPKTYNSNRLVSVPPSLAEYLHGITKNPFITLVPNNITKQFEDLCKRNNIKMRFHDLRHYNASVQIALGFESLEIQKRLGHATPNMLNNIYGHLLPERQVQMAKKLDEYFG